MNAMFLSQLNNEYRFVTQKLCFKKKSEKYIQAKRKTNFPFFLL